MKRPFSSSSAVLFRAGTSVVVLFFAGITLCAQQPLAGNAETNAAAARLEVPENVSQHAAPVQPLPFSHKNHVTLGLQCRQCHTNPAPGNQMNFPAVGTCMACHNNIAKDKPAIMKLAVFAKSTQPIPWVRVYQVTPGVNWTHRKHLQAGLQCVNCHGQVGQSDQLSETTAVTSMASCISCHQAHNAPTVCQTCHAWPTSGEARSSTQP